MELKIGDILYIRNENRRTYLRDENGKPGRIDPRGYWCERAIVGETRQSWLLGGPEEYKVDKATMELRIRELYGMDGRVYTAAEKEEKLWEDWHARAIVRLVERAAERHDIPTLRAIAALLGYEGE